MIMELPSIQSILSKYNEAESRHILNNFPLASLFTRKEKSDNKKLIECYPDSSMGFPGGKCYKIYYILDIAKFNKKYPNVRDYMEMFGKSVSIELGSKVDVSVGRALDNNTKQKSLAKAFDFDEDEVADAAESIFWELTGSIAFEKEMLGQNHLIGIVPDELMHEEVGLLERFRGFYRGEEKAVNSWDLGSQIINRRGINVHWYSSSFVDRVYILDKNAIEIVFSRLPPALPFPSDVFVDKESGFSKRKMYVKMYATNFCQPQNLCQTEETLQDDMQFRVYADFSRIRSFSCTS